MRLLHGPLHSRASPEEQRRARIEGLRSSALAEAIVSAEAEACGDQLSSFLSVLHSEPCLDWFAIAEESPPEASSTLLMNVRSVRLSAIPRIGME